MTTKPTHICDCPVCRSHEESERKQSEVMAMLSAIGASVLMLAMSGYLLYESVMIWIR